MAMPAPWRNPAFRRVMLGLIAYPAVTALVFWRLQGTTLTLFSLLVLAMPGLLFDFAVSRAWMQLVPLAGWSVELVISLTYPSCQSCGEDLPGMIVALTVVLYVVPATLAVGTGYWLAGLRAKRTSA